MQIFSTAREAKEYLIAQSVAEAEREHVPVSEVERKMMYFTETGWSLPDMWQVNEAFERDYDQKDYEAKIGAIAREAREHADAFDGRVDVWGEAEAILRGEDHYLLVLIDADAKSVTSPKSDRLKLIATAGVVTFIVLALFYFFSTK